MPTTTVIVPVFNGSAYLREFFDSLERALPDGSQVIVVDDGSTEPVFDAIPELHRAGEVILLRNDRNLGYSAAVNRAFELATGDVNVQLNTDLVLDERCITAMLDLIERRPNVGIVGSRLIYPTTGLVQHVGMAFGNHSKPHIFSELPTDHPLCRDDRQLQIVTGATVAMTAQVLRAIGPLDERYFNHNEDIDHCLRAIGAGFDNWMCAASVAHHWESISGPARFARVESSEARFWSIWGGRFTTDLGQFVDEALDELFRTFPTIAEAPMQVLDLSRGADQPIVLDRVLDRWPDALAEGQSFRQMNNPQRRLSLSLVLPHWVVSQPTPFVYLVDRHRELAENALWFANRRRIVQDEVVVDLTGAVVTTQDLVRPA